MAKRKSLEELSSEELYQIARQREEQEREHEEEARRAQVQALREERRALVTRQRSELAALDRQIRSLGGRATGAGRGGRRGSNLSQVVLDAVAKAGEISTTELREQMEANGSNVKNLSQTLAYLKRTGRLKSKGRGIYAVA